MSEKLTAWAVLDMDGDAFHSVHIFREEAEKAAFGLGTVVPLHYTEHTPAELSVGPCSECHGTGEVFEHADDCRDDLCALNGDIYSCAGKVEPCGCAAPSPSVKLSPEQLEVLFRIAGEAVNKETGRTKARLSLTQEADLCNAYLALDEARSAPPPQTRAVAEPEIWYRWRGPRGGWIFDTKKPNWSHETVEINVKPKPKTEEE